MIRSGRDPSHIERIRSACPSRQAVHLQLALSERDLGIWTGGKRMKSISQVPSIDGSF